MGNLGFSNFEKTVSVLATTFYVQGLLAGRDRQITLPDITYQAIDLKSMGTRSFPIVYLLDDMELKVTNQGLDTDMDRLLQGGSMEARWAQMAVNRFGSTREYGCRAYFNGVPKGLPGGDVIVGESSENEMTYAISKYRLIINEKEMINIDRDNNIITIAGKDYAKEIERFL